MRPVLFLDVDGPLIPFGGPSPYPSYGAAGADGNPLLARLDPAHGARLTALGCDLVWATTWGAEANEVIAPRLGLPELPFVEWPDAESIGSIHWKTAGLLAWADGRAFAWLDDEITDRDKVWVHRRSAAPALLHRVDPRHGLRAADYTVVRDWLRGLKPAGG
ncbi:hypothetical protein Kfla_6459 [Kribbella flavida DSM 17836]|uniref:Secreted protein n=1 Tax=Kribbella flavida (strain DSM 17836 / JCM 10339 / NBRC 14399) TaxID=479435 RepID=D2PY88_KRIFD|nr:HAD domain-containing protein [Kribbella flavida]ADB35456.1 hypothetical protein Kfla_6459 [Kribbella flavida DSM 17836]